MHTSKKTLSPKEIWQEYGYPVKTLEKWREKSTGPAWIKTGTRVKYRRSEFEAWLDANTIRPKGGGPAIN
jgi:hypothetical protein